MLGQFVLNGDVWRIDFCQAEELFQVRGLRLGPAAYAIVNALQARSFEGISSSPTKMTGTKLPS